MKTIVDGQLARQFIPVPPHRPRWLLPASPTARSFHQAAAWALYQPASRLGKAFRAVVLTTAYLGFFRLMPRLQLDSQALAIKVTDAIRPLLQTSALPSLLPSWQTLLAPLEPATEVAISLGTANAYQKVTLLFLGSGGTPLGLVKAGCTTQARALLANESQALQSLSGGVFHAFTPPIGLGFEPGSNQIAWLAQSVIAGRPTIAPATRRPELGPLVELTAFLGYRQAPLAEATFGPRLLADLEQPLDLGAQLPRTNREFGIALVERLARQKWAITQDAWPLVPAHGDFVPWNRLTTPSGQAGLFDWEYFQPAAPAGWDLIRYHFVQQHLLAHKPLPRTFQALSSSRNLHHSLDLYEKATDLRIPNRPLLLDIFFFDVLYDTLRRSIVESLGQ